MTLRLGSLFSGYAGLDMAVEQFFGAETAWHCQYDPEDKHQYAAAVLAHHWPGVPNLGDITAVDWAAVEPVDILAGGFPCTDVSLAGQRAGLNDQTRSGLWAHMARAIAVLRPRLAVIENVPGLLSAKADSDVEPCTWCVGNTGDQPVLRALGAVLGDLAGLGFDAEWASVRASEVGAPHPRNRVFVLAWPSAEDPDIATRGERWLAAPGQAQGGRAWADAGGRSGASAADADGNAVRDESVAQPEGRRPAVAELAGSGTPADSGSSGRIPAERDVQPRQPDAHWGAYGPAIGRWERILRVPAPGAVDDRGRLSPAFVEWLMGIPSHLTSVPAPPGMTASQVRNAQLKAAGNGVVPRQAYAALDLLWQRATAAVPRVAATTPNRRKHYGHVH